MQSDKIVGAAFFISLTGHCIFLSAPAMWPAPRCDKPPEDVPFKVEIEKPPLLPEIDVLGEEKKLKETVTKEESPPAPEKEIEEPAPEKPEPPREKVEVSDPDDEAMFRYQDMVKQRIEAMRRYPSWAKRQGVEGVSYIMFDLLPDGTARNVKIVRSSGSGILDEEALSTVKRASPFRPIPVKLSFSVLTMTVALVFQLN